MTRRSFDSPLLAVATTDEVDRLAAYAQHNTGRMTTDMTLGRPERAAALVRYYAALCRPLGLDAVLAVCQSWHETSWWSSWWFRAPRRNPAGIGVTGARAGQPGVGEWQPLDDGRFMKGRAYRTYAGAAMAHVHGLAMWAGADPHATALLAIRCGKAGATAYFPPALARGSATQWQHLGWAHNPRHIGWAHPGAAYGASIARLAREALAS